MGKHRRQNPHGSPTGRKLAGDRLAEDVHGRKGMHKQQREKGGSHRRLEGAERGEEPISRDEFQVLWLLFTRHHFSSPGIGWTDLVRELLLIDIPEVEVDTFMQGLAAKVRWLRYTPWHGTYLDPDYKEEIGDTLKPLLRAFKTP